ncbi:MAG: alpha/beta family hydrolase [Sneathiella sp.]
MNYLENGNSDCQTKMILAHGAGAAMDSPFMDYYAENLGSANCHVIRFEFPYMQIRREQGGRRPPDRQPKLLDCWRQVIADFGPAENLIIGGKSMGGRMASRIADECAVGALVCLGYPFYAAGKQDKPRTDHLIDIKTPTLIVQGDRDTMGNRAAVSSYELSPAIKLNWMVDGDHSFKPRKSSGLTEEGNWAAGCAAVKAFIHR